MDTKHKIIVKHCQRCKGSGLLREPGVEAYDPNPMDYLPYNYIVCPDCEGTGHVVEQENITVTTEVVVAERIDHDHCADFHGEPCVENPCIDCDLNSVAGQE